MKDTRKEPDKTRLAIIRLRASLVESKGAVDWNDKEKDGSSNG
jgi:hypothetical protein